MKIKASFLFFLAGILIWVPKLLMQLESPIWLTFVLGAAGLAFAIASRHFLLMAANFLLMISVFILMGIENYM
ncbi:hypothetical protein E2R51_13245 [Jeotgalibacillus sp. S-D1]|uniref:hypothetical protein n=1 Tax=Jeotgalibacillus sp. S-D1 TaxID=2552189 RepID=UPI001059319A|nr:hypothetical protein [Jeotgalibacillus sp. S-D1]TDL31333.1 hypothetical protein E2R51_13245 [Jeotgalibacillus sp. S-D1]